MACIDIWAIIVGDGNRTGHLGVVRKSLADNTEQLTVQEYMPAPPYGIFLLDFGLATPEVVVPAGTILASQAGP